MGLFSSKKSSTTLSTTNLMSDQRAVGDNGANVLSGNVGGSVSIVETDNEVVKDAFGFGKDALEFADGVAGQSIDGIFSLADSVFKTTEKANASVSQAYREAYQGAKDPDPIDTKVLLIGGVVLLAAVYFLSK